MKKDRPRAARELGNLEENQWEPPPWGFGSVHANDGYAVDRDVVAELHAVVEEITRKPVQVAKRRIGFLP